MADETLTEKAVPETEAAEKEAASEEVTLEYDQISPAPEGADCILRLSLKKGGRGVPRTIIVLRDVRAGTTRHALTEADGNVLLPITSDTDQLLLLATSPDPFVETWVRLYFCKRKRDESGVKTVVEHAGNANRWGNWGLRPTERSKSDGA
jgi:hypothetical protein